MEPLLFRSIWIEDLPHGSRNHFLSVLFAFIRWIRGQKPFTTLSKMQKSTSPIISRIDRPGKLTGRPLSEKEMDRIVRGLGGRPATAIESRVFREAIARTDAKISRQRAPA